MKMIEILVSPNGQSRIETKGFSGAECQAASRFLERTLGQTLCEDLTTEFHQLPCQQDETAQQACPAPP
jgi:hypothetical protein